MSLITDAVDNAQQVTTVPVRNNQLNDDTLHKTDVGIAQKEATDRAAYEEKYGETTGAGIIDSTVTQFKYGGNTLVNTITDLERMYDSGPVDPNWTNQKGAWIDENKGSIPDDQRWRYERTGNQAEATQMLKDVHEQNREMELLTRGGMASVFTGGLLAGAIDVDAPLMLFSGGLSAGAKAGLQATRAGRVLMGAAGGFATGTALGTIEEQVNPTAEWTTIPVMGLAGLTLGGAGGLFAGGRHPVEATLEEFGEQVGNNSPVLKRDLRDGITTHSDVYGSEEFDRLLQEEVEAPSQAPGKPAGEGSGSDPANPTAREPKALDPASLSEETGIPEEGTLGSQITGERGSIGARQLSGTGPGINSVTSKVDRDLIKNATTQNQIDDLDGIYYRPEQHLTGVAETTVKAASRFRDAVVATGLVTDFDRLFRSGSEVAKRFAYDTMEHASGILRNNRSAAALREHYEKQMQGAFMPYNDAWDTWAKNNGHSVWQKNFNPKLRQEFDEAVVRELNARWHDDPAIPRQVDPNIKHAADGLDEAMKRDVELNKGKPGEGSTKGYETIDVKSGYMPQKWSGAKINKLIASAGGSDVTVVRAVQEFYLRTHPGMKRDEARIFAQAAIDRARRNEAGTSSNILADMADADSRSAIEDLLRRNGASQADIDTLEQRLLGNAATRGQKGHTKQRLKIDMRDTASNGIKAMDLFETDLSSLISRRIRSGAGSAALSRKGIRSKADKEAIISAILEEQRANGPNAKPVNPNLKDRFDDLVDKDKQLTREDLLDIFSYFEGGPIAGGVSPVYARIAKATRLATLNGLGLTQMAETATTIASIGVGKFMTHAGEAIVGHLKNIDSPLVNELKHMNILVPEEKMFRDDLVFDAEQAAMKGEWTARLDQVMNKAQRIQGYTSGFYAVRNIQQRIAATAGADKILVGLRDGKLSAERMYDMGLDAAQQRNIKHYITTGVVEFEGNNLKKLNLDKWAPEDAEDFALNLNRVVNQDIQKAQIGENALLFHRDGLKSLFFQLKSFPMLALEKQAYRHLRNMDQQAAATFMYGLGLAAAVYTAKQTIAGRTDKLDAASVANGAFAMSNLTGWIPMWTDPLAGMLGMDDLKFNQYGKYGSTAVVSIPPSFTVLDRMAQIPGRAATLVPRMLAGDGMSYDDVQALKAMPLIGNAYGFSAMFNMMQ